ncbi:MAG TPA: hypothetical protein VEX11_01645, partial [Acetobacteraceae bacterium]|nr:hypothetical protein [Acetobacteraceae bacterium]
PRPVGAAEGRGRSGSGEVAPGLRAQQGALGMRAATYGRLCDAIREAEERVKSAMHLLIP